MGKRQLKKQSTTIFKRLTGKSLRILVIRAGFPYHKSPHLYQWLWVFILLPFLQEDSLNELAEKHGKELRKLYGILKRYPGQFERLLNLLSEPLFFGVLEEFEQNTDPSFRSRHQIKIIIDDTKAEKFGEQMEFIHKLFDHCKERYIEGYNFVLVLVAFGDLVFPLNIMMWLPQKHPSHRSKNDMVKDYINHLNESIQTQGKTLENVEIVFDSAYCVQKVMIAAEQAHLRVITKAGNTHKFEFEGAELTPAQIIEEVKNRPSWHPLDDGRYYQRLTVFHPCYGEIVMIIRRKKLKNGKITYDAIICNKSFYNAKRIDERYQKRWEIEMHFKYYKQHLRLGKGQFRKLGAIKSQLYCVALAGLVVALYRCQGTRKMSFRMAFKRIALELLC